MASDAAKGTYQWEGDAGNEPTSTVPISSLILLWVLLNYHNPTNNEYFNCIVGAHRGASVGGSDD